MPAADYKLLRVKPEDLEAAWPDIGHLMHEIADAEYSGHTIATLINEVETGNVELWVIARDKVVAIMGVTISPTGDNIMVLDIVLMQGTEMKRWFDQILAVVEDYARDRKCDLVQCTARKGWAKIMPDYKMSHVILRKVL